MDTGDRSCQGKHTRPVKVTRKRETIPESFKPTPSSKRATWENGSQDCKRSALKPQALKP